MNKLESTNNIEIEEVYNKIVGLIENAKRNVAIKVNSEMTFLYWNIGKDITENVLKNQKAEYGKTVIKELSEKLTKEYGRGYGERNVFRMIKFYDYFTDFEILSTLSTKLSWSHFLKLYLLQLYNAKIQLEQRDEKDEKAKIVI